MMDNQTTIATIIKLFREDEHFYLLLSWKFIEREEKKRKGKLIEEGRGAHFKRVTPLFLNTFLKDT